MLGTKVKPGGGSADKLQTKWDQLEDDRLTQADFYDDLLFPREGFLIEAGVAYPNELVMLGSMNQLQKALMKNSKMEWKIFPQPDGSRVVRLVNTGKEVKEAVKAKGMDPKKVNMEERPKSYKPRSGKHVTGKRTSSKTNDSNPGTELTLYKKPSRRKKGVKRSSSVPQLREAWERRPIKTKYQLEKRYGESGDCEPYSREELEKTAAEKKRFLEEMEQKAKKKAEEKDNTVEIYRKSSSVGDVSDSDSDSSGASFKTRIIRFSSLKVRTDRSNMPSSRKGVIITDITDQPSCSRQVDNDTDDKICRNEIWCEVEKNVVFDQKESGIVSVVDRPEEENKETGEKVDNDIDKVEDNMSLIDPRKLGKEMLESVIKNRDPSKRTEVGIFDREQWHRDVAINSNLMKRRFVKDGYSTQMQKETSDRLAIPKFGPFSAKPENDLNKGTKQVSEIPKNVLANNKNNLVNTKPVKTSENEKTNKIKKVRSQSQVLKKKHGEGSSGPDTKSKYSRHSLYSKNKLTKSVSSVNVNDPPKNRAKPIHPYNVKQKSFIDVSSRSSKNSVRSETRPEFNIRTTQGLYDIPKQLASSGRSEPQPPKRRTRAMPPMAETSIETSSAVNRRKEMRNIDCENQKMSERLSRIRNVMQTSSKNNISLRGSRHEQLPFARIQNRALTK